MTRPLRATEGTVADKERNRERSKDDDAFSATHLWAMTTTFATTLCRLFHQSVFVGFGKEFRFNLFKERTSSSSQRHGKKNPPPILFFFFEKLPPPRGVTLCVPLLWSSRVSSGRKTSRGPPLLVGFSCANNYDTTKERVMMRDARKKKWGPSKSPLPLRLSKSLPNDRFFFRLRP